MRRVLIIDDEPGLRTSLSLLLADEGFEVDTAQDAVEAEQRVASSSYEVVLCDVRMPGRSGIELLPDLVRAQPQATVLVMSAFGDVDQALEAVRRGAYDYLQKPFQSQELLLTIQKAEERERLRRENRRLQRELQQRQPARPLVAASEPMRAVVELIERSAEYKTTVLITGESGVGKEVVAHAIHDLSERSPRPFVPVNCGAIPETLIESELFGHMRGAFTGADREKAGLFREADGGTLFLDEIGELPLHVQVKLLRVLQEEEIQPIGASKAQTVDVRILAATARDLEAEVRTGSFREDLYYRLNVVRIHVPPLRERPADIAPLADQLYIALSRRMGKPVDPLGKPLLAALRAHSWPGNVRELENTLERAILLAPAREITVDLLPFAATDTAASAAAIDSGNVTHSSAGTHNSPGTDSKAAAEDLSIKRRTRLLEERLIGLALDLTGGNRTRAARILEISPRTLQYKLKEYGADALNRGSAPADSD